MTILPQIRNKTILITGGSGTFGRAFARECLDQKAKKVIIYSRSEFLHWEMQRDFNNDPRLRFFIGDVRDSDRLKRAFNGVDIVVHAAALKQVPACEYNPEEALKTNTLGAVNIVNTAIDCGVRKVVALSTDKAVNPINLYGATKTAAEKVFINGNVYSGDKKTRISMVRYGNVAGSRGSIIPLFKEMIKQGKKILPLTSDKMTRFHIELDDAIKLVLFALQDMKGGEIYIPKIPSFRVADLIKHMGCRAEIIGIRQGEKLHETLVSIDEAYKCYDNGKYYVICEDKKKGNQVKADFSYSSDNNSEWLYRS